MQDGKRRFRPDDGHRNVTVDAGGAELGDRGAGGADLPVQRIDVVREGVQGRGSLPGKQQEARKHCGQ